MSEDSKSSVGSVERAKWRILQDEHRRQHPRGCESACRECVKRLGRRLALEPPAEWSPIFEALPVPMRPAVVKWLEDRAQWAARTAFYTSAREMGYPHDRALAVMNQNTRKVRILLGYSNPHGGDLRF